MDGGNQLVPNPIRFPLAAPLGQRLPDPFLNRDPYLLNAYIEKGAEGRLYVNKRPGTLVRYTVGAGGAQTSQGMWCYKTYILAAFGNTLYNVNHPVVNNYSTGGAAAWTQDANATWQARRFSASCVFRNQIWIIGGNDAGTTTYNDVWSSPDGQTWTQVISAAPWTPRLGASLVVLNDKMYIIGGVDHSGPTYLNDVWVTDDGVTWTQLTDNAAFAGRAYFGAVAFNNGIFIMGGFDGAVAFNDVWFSTDGETWVQQVVTASWGVRELFSVLSFKGKMYVIGGFDPAGPTYRNDVYSSPDGITWTSESAAAFGAGRAAYAATVYDGKMWVFGGTTGAASAQVYSTSTGTGAWTLVTSAPGWTARSGMAAVAFKAPVSVGATVPPILWVIGGFDGAAVVNEVWRSNINGAAAASWAIPAPSGVQVLNSCTCNANEFLLLKDTAALYVLWGNNLSIVTDNNYPSLTVPGIVNLDETVYVMDPSGVIYGSSLGVPTVWPSFNFIGADFESDEGVALCKYSNYVVALGQFTTQLFYNSGSRLGSLLKPVKNANAKVGCAFARSVVEFKDNVMWVGRDVTTDGRRVYTFAGVNPVEVSDPFMDRILNIETVSSMKAVAMRVGGHDFYLLTIGFLGDASFASFAFDLDLKQWYAWGNGNSRNWLSHFAATDGSYNMQMMDGFGYIIYVSPAVFQDFNGSAQTSMTVQGVTLPQDGGVSYNKFCGRTTFVGDREVGSTIAVSWSDDDYQSYTTPRSVSVDQLRPALRGCGKFIRRALKWTHTANTAFRGEAFELTVDLGNG